MTDGTRLWLGPGTALAWAAVDQATKFLVVERIMVPPRTIPITGFFNLVLGRNAGVSFGLLGDVPAWLLLLLGSGIVAFLIGWMIRAAGRVTRIALALIIGGAIGNIVDRLRFGAVTDFLDFHVTDWHWPAFNLADAGICVGVALLALESFFSRWKSPLSSRIQ